MICGDGRRRSTFPDMRGSARLPIPASKRSLSRVFVVPLFGQAANGPRMRPDEIDAPSRGRPDRAAGTAGINWPGVSRGLLRVSNPMTPRYLRFCFGGGDGQVAGWRAVRVA